MSSPVERAEQVFQGLGVSPGIAIGRAVSIASQEHEIIRFPIPPDRIDEEIARLDEALGKAQAEIEAMRLKAGAELGAELAGVFEAHSLMLNDAAFVGKLRARIAEERVNAEWAVHETAEDLASRFARLEAERFREKSQDLVDVSRHLLRCLGAISHHDISELEGEIIVVAHDLTPSEAIRLGRNRVVGFALETGGRTSHTAIIARSLHIPLVTGLPGVTELVTDDDPVIVDGNKGLVTLHATAE
ncbi:MAG: PEP-utilizing enzyme, partial [Acidobacteriota bacterium]|nr:PEP-utilizing enzyme [Acidobacteriota bacterium]